MVKANGYGLGADRGRARARAARPVGLRRGLGGRGRRAPGRGHRAPDTRRESAARRRGRVDTSRTIFDPPSAIPSRSTPGRSDRRGRFTSRSTPGWPRRGALGRSVRARASARMRSSTLPGWEGVFTHFHSAESDAGSASVQWDRFQGVAGGPASTGRDWCTPPIARRRSGAKAFAADLIRPGIFLYGGEAGRDAEDGGDAPGSGGSAEDRCARVGR